MNDDALFCHKCGTKVQRVCHRCGCVVTNSGLFCHQCGASLNPLQPVPEEVLISVARAVAHRLNNALAIVLANSQLAERQIISLPQDAGQELRQYLEDIAVAAEGGGSVMREFQRLLDSIANRYSQEEISVYAEQITDNLRVPDNPEPQVSHATAGGKKPTRLGNISVLIVDDEEKIRHALSYALTLDGHHVITASDGQEALTLVQSGSYGIAFVDLKMPGMNGWEVSDAIKRIDPDTVVVLMTGWNIQLDDERLRENQVDAVVMKPFELSQITDLALTMVEGNDGGHRT